MGPAVTPPYFQIGPSPPYNLYRIEQVCLSHGHTYHLLLLRPSSSMAQKDHIILFPSLGQGHFISFMSLATLLDHRYHCAVTYVSTPANIHNLKSTLPLNSTIRLAALPFHGPDHSLPPNKESVDLLPHDLAFRLLEAFQTLQPAFESLVQDISREHGRRPLAIISDMSNSWAVEIANRLNIFHAVFVSSGAYGTAVYFSLWLNLPHTKTDSDEFILPDFPEPVVIQRNQLAPQFKATDESDFIFKFHRRMLPLCWHADGFLFNTFEELEQTGLGYFRRKSGKPVWAIGPLKTVAQGRKQPGVSAERCIAWLDLRPPSSVLFVSFGSHNTIGASQMMELAMGLEASGRPFIWVIRPPLGFDKDGEFRAEWLPEGFEERVSERKQGVLVRRWGPQLEILSHASTGVFLSHCGWNSTVESLSRGVPMIGWPMSAEQFYNVKMMEEELGVCVEMARGNSADIGRNDVERVIELVMGGSEKGEEMKKKALQVKEMTELAVREDEECKGSSTKALDEFLKTISAKAETKAEKVGNMSQFSTQMLLR